MLTSAEKHISEAEPLIDSAAVQRRLDAALALEAYIGQEGNVLYEPQSGVMHEIQRFIADNAENKAWGYVSLPTGSGKTVIFQQLAEATGLRTLVVAPKKRLVEQARNTFDKFDSNLTTGLLYTHEHKTNTDVVITTASSLIEHTDRQFGRIKPQDFELLILDEAHRALASGTQKVVRENFQHAITIGFTATKEFNNERRVEQLLPLEIYDMPITEAVDKRLIAPFSNMVLLSDYARMSKVAIRRGEYEPHDLNRAINTDPRNRALAEFYAKNLKGQRALFFCNSIDHSEAMAHALQREGVRAYAIHSKLKQAEQQELYSDFEKPISAGGLEALCTVRLLTEGFDSQSASVCINVSPTLSYALEQQRSGRVQRLDPHSPDKHALIIDVLDHMDLGQYRPPVLYSHERIAGVARHTVNGFHPPLDSAQAEPVEGLALMHEPAEIEQLVTELDKAGCVDASPEIDLSDWCSVKDLSREAGLSINLLQRALEALKAGAPELFEDTNLVYSTSPGSPIVFSRAMTEIIINNTELIDQAPKGWLKGSQIAILAGKRDRVDIQSQLRRAREELPAYHVGEYVDSIGQGNAVQYFSPRAVNHVLQKFGRYYSPDMPPEGWPSEVQLAERYGADGINLLLYGQNGLLSVPRNRPHLIRFNQEAHFSPVLARLVESNLSAPSGYKSIIELRVRYELATNDFDRVMAWASFNKHELADGRVWDKSDKGNWRSMVTDRLFETWSRLAADYTAATGQYGGKTAEVENLTISKSPEESESVPLDERFPHMFVTDEDEDNEDFDWATWEEVELAPVDSKAPEPKIEQEFDFDDFIEDDEDEVALLGGSHVNNMFPNWREHVHDECNPETHGDFFPERGGSTRLARETCRNCKASQACLMFAIETNESFGIWGGMNERSRRHVKQILKIGGTWEDIFEVQDLARGDGDEKAPFKSSDIRRLTDERIELLTQDEVDRLSA